MGHRHTRRSFLAGAAALTACGADHLTEFDAGPRAPVDEPVSGYHSPSGAHPALGPIDELDAQQQRLYVHAEAFAPLGTPTAQSWRTHVDEPHQSYADYLVSAPNLPRAPRRRLYLLPLGTFPRDLVIEPVYVVMVTAPDLHWLADYIERFYGLPVTIMDPRSIDALDIPTREYNGHLQFDARALLRAIAPFLPNDAYSMTALLHRDLYIHNDQDYAFGYGLHRGRLAAMSVAHFDPIFMGRSRPNSWRHDIDRRSLTVLAHEVGHTFGMRHCGYYQCVLNGMSHPREIDETPPRLCPICLRKLMTVSPQEPIERYRKLAQFYETAQMHHEAGWVRWRIEHVRAAS